ncbi:MAG: universal stress protein [Maricaulaceae bacterium]|nr:universal stress protein [Maricaulaceae bacterium]
MGAHRRKFLVIADDSPESHAAVYYAARRARATDGMVTILAVVDPAQFNGFIGVADAMRAEATERAETALESLAEEAEAVTGARPELLLREGEMTAVLTRLIEEDEGLAILVLGAAASGEGPGPLVSSLARGKGLFGARPVPVTVVPGGLDRAAIDALT